MKSIACLLGFHNTSRHKTAGGTGVESLTYRKCVFCKQVWWSS